VGQRDCSVRRDADDIGRSCFAAYIMTSCDGIVLAVRFVKIPNYLLNKSQQFIPI